MTIMTKRKPSLPSDDDHPEDLFGPPNPKRLETLPPPVNEPKQDGPPSPSLWQKGGPSPNPKGRPPKSRMGPVTKFLVRKITVRINGAEVWISRRETIDRRLRDDAVLKGGGYLKLWRERQARDRRLEAERQEYAAEIEEHNRLEIEHPERWKRMQQARRHKIGSDFLDTVEEARPGYLDILSKLKSAGAIAFTDGQLIVADWLEKLRPASD